MSSIVQIRFPRPDVAVVCMDTPNRPGNVLDDQLFSALDSAIDQLSANESLHGVILVSAKPKIFVAGADLNRIQQTADYSDEQIITFCEQGRAVMKKFSCGSLPFGCRDPRCRRWRWPGNRDVVRLSNRDQPSRDETGAPGSETWVGAWLGRNKSIAAVNEPERFY